jgi:hypothetical protein
MPIKGTAATVVYRAWDTAANAPKTGDAANHTLRRLVDGGAAQAITATPVERENGYYAIALTAGENSGDSMTVEGASSTPGVQLIGCSWMNTPAFALAEHYTAARAAALDNIEADTNELQTRLATMIEARGDDWRFKAQAVEGVFLVGLADVEDAAPGNSLCTVCLAALHSSVAGSTWTIKKTDGTTKITRTVAVDPAAQPIVGVT